MLRQGSLVFNKEREESDTPSNLGKDARFHQAPTSICKSPRFLNRVDRLSGPLTPTDNLVNSSASFVHLYKNILNPTF